MTVSTAYLGLGANLGDPPAQLARAVDALRAWPHSESVDVSSAYRTAYVGPGEQPDYLNLCVRMCTTLSIEDLHAGVKALEAEVEGKDREHMAPRKLDIDLLLFEDRVLESENLQVPHPRLRQRRFVLEPLVEFDEQLSLPPDGCLLRELLMRPEIVEQNVIRLVEPLGKQEWGGWDV